MFKTPKPNTHTALHMTFLSEGSNIEGNLHINGNFRVDGTIRGSLTVQGDLEVASSARIEGKHIEARNITVHGEVLAPISAHGKLFLSKTAKVRGDVTATALDIEAGAVFVGHSSTGVKENPLLPLPEKAQQAQVKPAPSKVS